jgi:peptidoglycan-associated lipoprotein
MRFLTSPVYPRRFTASLFFSGLIVLTLSGCSLFSSSKKSETGAEDPFSEESLNAQRDERFGSGSIPSAEGEGVLRDIYFDFDSSLVDDGARQAIEYNASVLRDNPDVKIQLEGHCDERGTAEYNLALGNQRARAVLEVLLSLGLERARLDTISYGEEVPLDSHSNEEAWAKNRRVHFTAFRDLPKK